MTENETLQLPGLADLWQTTLGWQPNSQQQAQFQQLYDLTLAANRQFNLTRITAPNDFWEKHLWDSLSGITPFLTGSRMKDKLAFPESFSFDSTSFKAIDIGTGAGFPGIPLAIACPNWTVTLLDSTRKKINFLQTLTATMGLENVNTWVDRAEQVGRHPNHRAQYDLATIRAVATAPVCAEYALPLLKVGGLAILYRGQWSDLEAEALQAAVAHLGGAIVATETLTTPLSHSIRHCLYLHKQGPTPIDFPRPVGVPTQTPLTDT